jgi:hypothetical protein
VHSLRKRRGYLICRGHSVFRWRRRVPENGDDAGGCCSRICNPNLRAIIFRSQFTQMTDIVDKTFRLYNPIGAK